MIEFLLPAPPTKFAKMVASWGAHGGKGFMVNRVSGEKRKPVGYIESKSYTLGAYPRNVIGMKDLEIKND